MVILHNETTSEILPPSPWLKSWESESGYLYEWHSLCVRHVLRAQHTQLTEVKYGTQTRQ